MASPVDGVLGTPPPALVELDWPSNGAAQTTLLLRGGRPDLGGEDPRSADLGGEASSAGGDAFARGAVRGAAAARGAVHGGRSGKRSPSPR